MVIIKKKLTAAAVISFTILGLCACGKETARVSTVSVDKEGKVESVLYDAFDKDYYSLDELKNMAEEEISDYNSEYENPRITLSDAQVLEEEGVVKLTMQFESAQDYSYFNQVDMFYGTVEDARNAGYELNLNLVDDKGDKIDPSIIDQNPDRHIIITSDKTNIKTPYNIEYMSKGVNSLGKKEAELHAVTAEYAQLLLSK